MLWRTSVLLLALGAVASADFSTLQGLQPAPAPALKAECPQPSMISNTLNTASDRVNKYEGSCEVTEENVDSCRFRMSCCENYVGDFLCVRAHRYAQIASQQRLTEQLRERAPTPPERADGVMLNDATQVCPTVESLNKVGLECKEAVTVYGFQATQCKDNTGCEGGRSCCADPCTEGLNICLPSAEELKKESVAPPKAVPAQLNDFSSGDAGEGTPVNRVCPTPFDICEAPDTCAPGEISCDGKAVQCKTDADCPKPSNCCANPCDAAISICYAAVTETKIELPEVKIMGLTDPTESKDSQILKPVGAAVAKA